MRELAGLRLRYKIYRQREHEEPEARSIVVASLLFVGVVVVRIIHPVRLDVIEIQIVSRG